MTHRAIFVGLSIALSVAASFGADLEFVGTTPADKAARALVGGFDQNAPVHCLTWHLHLSGVEKNGGVFKASVKYGLPGKDDPNQLHDGPIQKLEGKWERRSGKVSGSETIVFKLLGPSEQDSLAVARVGENLLHFLNNDGSLKIGNGGWSYTLSRKGVGAEK